MIATADNNWSLYPLDEVLFQAILTLNLMRSSRIDPLISAWEAACGEFDMNATSIVPAGTKVVIHEMPNERGSWDAHGVEGF